VYKFCNRQLVKFIATFSPFDSTENLDGDVYLRAQMDEQGWVPLTLIAGFNKVSFHMFNSIHKFLKGYDYFVFNFHEEDICSPSIHTLFLCFQVCSKTTNMELILDSILPSTEVDVVVIFLALHQLHHLLAIILYFFST
jgi:hypothetical protein